MRGALHASISLLPIHIRSADHFAIVWRHRLFLGGKNNHGLVKCYKGKNILLWTNCGMGALCGSVGSYLHSITDKIAALKGLSIVPFQRPGVQATFNPITCHITRRDLQCSPYHLQRTSIYSPNQYDLKNIIALQQYSTTDREFVLLHHIPV